MITETERKTLGSSFITISNYYVALRVRIGCKWIFCAVNAILFVRVVLLIRTDFDIFNGVCLINLLQVGTLSVTSRIGFFFVTSVYIMFTQQWISKVSMILLCCLLILTLELKIFEFILYLISL